MSVLEIATLYRQVVAIHDAIPDDEPIGKDLVAGFRSDLHYALMETFREHGIEFHSRDEAARIAFRMVLKAEAGESTMANIPRTTTEPPCPA